MFCLRKYTCTGSKKWLRTSTYILVNFRFSIFHFPFSSSTEFMEVYTQIDGSSIIQFLFFEIWSPIILTYLRGSAEAISVPGAIVTASGTSVICAASERSQFDECLTCRVIGQLWTPWAAHSKLDAPLTWFPIMREVSFDYMLIRILYRHSHNVFLPQSLKFVVTVSFAVQTFISADIGGTNTRLRIFEISISESLENPCTSVSGVE